MAISHLLFNLGLFVQLIFPILELFIGLFKIHYLFLDILLIRRWWYKEGEIFSMCFKIEMKYAVIFGTLIGPENESLSVIVSKVFI